MLHQYFIKIKGIRSPLKVLPVHGKNIVDQLFDDLMNESELINFPAYEIRVSRLRRKELSFYKFVVYTESIQSYEQLLRLGLKF